MRTDVVKNYITKAEHDLGTAILTYKNNPDYTDTITFHSQQTIEKMLKAFLSFHKIKVKTSHNIVFLLNQCTDIEPKFEKFETDDFIDINQQGMRVRYDDIENDPETEEAFRYLELAKVMRNFVVTCLEKEGYKH